MLFLRSTEQAQETIHKMQTLRLRRPFGQTLLLSLSFLCLLAGSIEIVLRIEPVASALPNSNFGGRHEQLETQFARLDHVVAQEGPVDCFLLGDSLVWLGVDPEAFQNAYKDATGQSLHCFNFGVSAMPAVAAAQLAGYLVDTYDPKLLIYGVHARNLAVPLSDEESQIIINNPWFQYRRGTITVSNWIKAQSVIFQNLDYVDTLRRLDMRTARDPLGWQYRQLHGFDAKARTLLDVDEAPNPEDPDQESGFKWYWNYQIQEENLAAVRHIAELDDQERQVIVVVMPVHTNFKKFFRHGEQDYARFLSSVEETMAQTGTPFWVLEGAVTIPTDGWFDYSHLNLDGASVFSAWFGTQVGDFMQPDP